MQVWVSEQSRLRSLSSPLQARLIVQTFLSLLPDSLMLRFHCPYVSHCSETTQVNAVLGSV